MGLLLAESGTNWGLAVGAVVVGLVGGWIAKLFIDKQRKATAEAEAGAIISRAEGRAGEIVQKAEVDAKAEFLSRQEKFETEATATRAELREAEKRLEKREDQLDQKLDMLSLKERNIEKAETQVRQKSEEIEKKSAEISDLLVKQRNELLKITQLSMDDAKRQLFQKLENELEHECAEIVNKQVTEAQDEAENRSREIVITAVSALRGSAHVRGDGGDRPDSQRRVEGPRHRSRGA